MEGFYKVLFQNKNLIDIEPAKVVPTWRNGRSGTNAIWKRLDRFLVSEGLLSSVDLYRSWVEYLLSLTMHRCYFNWISHLYSKPTLSNSTRNG
jgi:hypothetical protein